MTQRAVVKTARKAPDPIGWQKTRTRSPRRSHLIVYSWQRLLIGDRSLSAKKQNKATRRAPGAVLPKTKQFRKRSQFQTLRGLRAVRMSARAKPFRRLRTKWTTVRHAAGTQTLRRVWFVSRLARRCFETNDTRMDCLR